MCSGWISCLGLIAILNAGSHGQAGPAGSKEPTDMSKTVSDWLEQLQPAAPEQAPTALQALLRIGPAAVPALTTALHDSNPRVRAAAFTALEGLGVHARSALPKLLRILQDNKHPDRERAVYLLGNTSAEAIPLLVPVLKEGDAVARRGAALALAYALAYFGSADKAAMTALMQSLQDDDAVVRCHSAYALGAIGSASRSAVPLLIPLLKDRQPEVRRSAAFALAGTGSLAAEAVPDLLQALKDDSAPVRASAAYALGLIGSRPDRTIPALKSALQDSEPDVRGAAIRALECLGERGE